MEDRNKNIVVYAAIAVIVLVGVYAFASSALNPSYSISMQLSPATQPSTLYPYNTTILHLYINNTGGADISSLPVVLYLNGVALQTLDIQSLPPDHVSQENFSYTYPSSGSYNFSVIADPSHLFNIQNRQAAETSFTAKVYAAELPNVYLSIPNNGIMDTQSFSFTKNGTGEALYLDSNYSLQQFSDIFDGNVPALMQIFKPLFPYIGYFNGAYANYTNGTAAYTAWVQSGASAADMAVLLNRYNYSISNFTVGSEPAFYTKLNATTSMCMYYDQGWTKIVVYGNDSSASTCRDIIMHTYSGSESNTLVQQLKADPVMFNYQNITRAYNANIPTFIYEGAYPIGSSIASDNGVLTTINFFQTYATNSSSGAFFAGLMKRNIPPANSMQRLCFDGIVFNGNTANVCSRYTSTSTGYFGEPILLNSTQITSNYTISLYSLVNGSIAPAAHLDAVALMQSLKLNESRVHWKSMYQNSCIFNASEQIGCGFVGVNISSYAPSFTLTNNYPSKITLQNVSCSYDAQPKVTPIDVVMQPGNTLSFSVPCSLSPPLGFVVGIQESLNATYIVNGQHMSDSGIFNFTFFK
jgi:hypothetical protein